MVRVDKVPPVAGSEPSFVPKSKTLGVVGPSHDGP